MNNRIYLFGLKAALSLAVVIAAIWFLAGNFRFFMEFQPFRLVVIIFCVVGFIALLYSLIGKLAEMFINLLDNHLGLEDSKK